MKWLATEFKPYCERNGLKLLSEDIKFIEKCLWRVPEKARKSIMRDYLREWTLGGHEAPNASQRQNWGRRRANRWLDEVTTFDKT